MNSNPGQPSEGATTFWMVVGLPLRLVAFAVLALMLAVRDSLFPSAQFEKGWKDAFLFLIGLERHP